MALQYYMSWKPFWKWPISMVWCVISTKKSFYISLPLKRHGSAASNLFGINVRPWARNGTCHPWVNCTSYRLLLDLLKTSPKFNASWTRVFTLKSERAQGWRIISLMLIFTVCFIVTSPPQTNMHLILKCLCFSSFHVFFRVEIFKHRGVNPSKALLCLQYIIKACVLLWFNALIFHLYKWNVPGALMLKNHSKTEFHFSLPLSSRAESCCVLQCFISPACAWDETPSMNNVFPRGSLWIPIIHSPLRLTRRESKIISRSVIELNVNEK